jgi:EmrB/QacA subfamily drug resistance transporter
VTSSAVPVGTRRWLVLAICCLSVAVTAINLSMVNIALPSIGRELHASISDLQWTVSAYSLAMACLLLLSGSTADRVGRRRIFQIGLIVFTLGSLASSLAPSVGWLIASSALQGVGGSMLNPVALSLVVGVFTDSKERARAIGIWGSVIGIGIALGPVLGGLLVDALGWRSVFWVDVLLAALAVVLTRLFVPELRAGRARAFDLPGQLLIIVLFGSVVSATIEGPRLGWGNALTIGLFLATGAALLGLLVIESRRAQPLIDLRFFRSPPFSGANAISVLLAAGLGGFLFLNTLFLQDVRHYTPLQAGLLVLPLAVGQVAASIAAGRLVAARGTRLTLSLGATLLTLGGSALIPLTSSTPMPGVLGAYVLFGAGVGMISPSVTTTAVAGMPQDQVGVAGALAASARQFGSAIGVAVVGAIASSSSSSDFTSAAHGGWTVVAGCGLISLILAISTTGHRARQAALRNGARLSADVL